MSRNRGTYDLTSGSILNKLLLVALPIMGTQLLQMTYNLTDMFWLGRVGSDAVAASGTAGMFMWLSNGFLLIGRMGSEIGVAQSMGRSEPEAARAYSQNSLFLSGLLGVFFGLVLILFQAPLVGFFNIQEAHVAADTRLYLSIAGIGMPFTFLSGAIAGSFNGSGNSKTPFLVNAVGLVANMILDPLLIFPLGLGIAGAGIATVAAQILVCALMLVAIKRDKNRPFSQYTFFARPDRDRIRQILRWSVPIGLESMLFTLLSMIISRFVASFGAQAIAVNRVGSQIESLSWLVGGGFGSALTSFVGQNYGAGKWSRIHKGYRISTVVMVFYGLGVSMLLFFGGGLLFSIFLPDPAIVAMGIPYLKILSLIQVFACLEFVASGAFKGTGRTMPPSVISFTCNALRVFVAYGLSRTSLGLNGIWIGIASGAAARGIWAFCWYLLANRKLPAEDIPIKSAQQ